MLTLLFCVALIYVAVTLLVWGIKAAWGIAKLVEFLVLLPIIVIWLAVSGLILIALGVLILAAVFTTIGVLLGV